MLISLLIGRHLWCPRHPSPTHPPYTLKADGLISNWFEKIQAFKQEFPYLPASKCTSLLDSPPVFRDGVPLPLHPLGTAIHSDSGVFKGSALAILWFFWIINTSPLYHSNQEKYVPYSICTPVFQAALFTIATKWEHPNDHPQMSKENAVYTHNGTWFSLREGRNLGTCSNMGEP